MSVVIGATQSVASDFAFQQLARPVLCPGSLCWTKKAAVHQFINAQFVSRSTGRLTGGLGFWHRRGQHGSRVRPGVVARDSGAPAATSPTVVDSELVVLGLSADAVERVAPVGSTHGALVHQSSLLPGQLAGKCGTDCTISPVLAAAEALAGESDGLRSAPAQLHGALPNGASLNDSTDVCSAQTLPGSVATTSASSSSLGRLANCASSSPQLYTVASLYVDAQVASSALCSDSGVTGAAIEALPCGHAIAAHSHDEQSQPKGNKKPTVEPLEVRNFQKQGFWERIDGILRSIHWGKLWALVLLSVSYVHQATTGFALPAMLPMISNELYLTDIQGALLTTGYSYLYAVALVPIGLLADRVSRPKLLAAGLMLWSALTCTASTCRSFGDLMLARVGFAAAQGPQNPVCFSLIPELFPINKSTALALYNCAIYVGRALSFAAVLLARHLHDNDQVHLAARGGLRMETRLDHLDRADLHSMAIMHTAGDMAAATPDREFNFPLWEYGNELPDAAWRQVLRWIAIPGFLIGLAMIGTLQDPREAVQTPTAVAVQLSPTTTTLGVVPGAAAAASALPAPPLVSPSGATAAATAIAAVPPGEDSVPEAARLQQPAGTTGATQDGGGSGGSILRLLRSPGFMSVTMAAALNDVGSYALIAWQSTFYERVYGLEPSSYAPVLAALLPIGGILGGVGGGYLADRLSRNGRRAWVTAGATCLAAPCLAASCLAPSPELSYAALVVGFGLSEMWRAPSAVMARGIAPASMGSTASALYLCLRNLVGGLGPLVVAALIGVCGLQQAMMVVPAMYLGSGVVFAKAEKLYDKEMAERVKLP